MERWSRRRYDEWRVGNRIEHDIRRTVTATDNLLLSTMTHNSQPLHLDAEAAKASEFGRILVNGTFTFTLTVGLSVGDKTLGTLVANLGYDKLVVPAPMFIGDTLRDQRGSQAARQPLAARSGAGDVPPRTHQPGQETVFRCLRTSLLKRRRV